MNNDLIHFTKFSSYNLNLHGSSSQKMGSGGRGGFCHRVLKFISPFLRTQPPRQTQPILIGFWLKFIIQFYTNIHKDLDNQNSKNDKLRQSKFNA